MSSHSPLIAQLDLFEKRLAVLVGEVRYARQRIRELENENAGLSELVQKQQQQLKQVQKKTSNEPASFSKSTNFVKIVSDNRTGTTTIADLKQQLTVYIDELDRCMAYLSNLS